MFLMFYPIQAIVFSMLQDADVIINHAKLI